LSKKSPAPVTVSTPVRVPKSTPQEKRGVVIRGLQKILLRIFSKENQVKIKRKNEKKKVEKKKRRKIRRINL
jgi:hypothetical protein